MAALPVAIVVPFSSVAIALVNVTEPKSASGTGVPLTDSFSTIQPASTWHSGDVELKVAVPVLPVDTFLMVATAVVLDVASMVAAIVSPKEHPTWVLGK